MLDSTVSAVTGSATPGGLPAKVLGDGGWVRVCTVWIKIGKVDVLDLWKVGQSVGFLPLASMGVIEGFMGWLVVWAIIADSVGASSVVVFHSNLCPTNIRPNPQNFNTT